jgi:AbrB family looped-hinge helix DNA binding protein
MFYISWTQDFSCESTMSEIDVVTVSSRGQVSIPADVRRELGLEEGAKLLVVSQGDNILLKKVDESFVEKSLEDILKPMWEQAEEAGVSEADAEELVDEHREEN